MNNSTFNAEQAVGFYEMVNPEDKRTAVAHRREGHSAKERRPCGLVEQPRPRQRHGVKPVVEGMAA
ncbi:MAG: hypothetical protein ABJC09_16530 [Terriglobia bacterium]